MLVVVRNVYDVTKLWVVLKSSGLFESSGLLLESSELLLERSGLLLEGRGVLLNSSRLLLDKWWVVVRDY